MTEPIRVVLCDDHRVVRAGLARILQAEPDLAVVGEAGTAAGAETLACQARPDVLVLDVGLPDRSGIEAVPWLRQVAPATQVLMLTMHDDIGYLRRAFDAGASGYLPKDAADVELVAAVRSVAGGGQYVHPSLGARLLHEPARTGSGIAGPGGRLSAREAEVLRLLALGHTNAEIAGQLFVSERTVETHRAHIRHKLEVTSQAQLVDTARRAGLLESDPTTVP